MRILFLGESAYGSCARACCAALRRMGHEVQDVDLQAYFPALRRRSSRGIMRALRPLLVGEYNEAIVRVASWFDPQVVLAVKGQYIERPTLLRLRARGAALYNYYPDPSAFAYGPWIPSSLPEYDCVFYTKPFWEEDVARRIRLRAARFVRHGYDPEVHRRLELTDEDVRRYGRDVLVVTTYAPNKEAFLDRVVRLLPDLDLKIWGNGWTERCRSAEVRKRLAGCALTGHSYAKAIRAGKVNLALLVGALRGASQGDETTMRTFEIPACGGFMLHPRTPEVGELFEEGREIACYGSAEEAAEKIEYYLAHPEDRAVIAAAGHARSVPAYSYDTRMREILAWHESRGGRGS